MLKRAIDTLVAGCGLLLLSPLLVTIGFVVLLVLGRPVLFTQKRPGLHGKPFTLIKFRTMREPSEREDRLKSDGQRLNTLGRFLRATSMDEVPELWNVLRGDMSLVGPRPLLTEYLPLYSPRQARRHEAKPGITGWAQVNGRNAASWEEKLELDVWYVDHQSFSLDIRILARTVMQVLRRQGINQPGQATAEPFRGNAETECG